MEKRELTEIIKGEYGEEGFNKQVLKRKQEWSEHISRMAEEDQSEQKRANPHWEGEARVNQEKDEVVITPLTKIRHKDEERTGNCLYKKKEKEENIRVGFCTKQNIGLKQVWHVLKFTWQAKDIKNSVQFFKLFQNSVLIVFPPNI